MKLNLIIELHQTVITQIDHEALNRDLVLKGKNETMRRFNCGEYDVKY